MSLNPSNKLLLALLSLVVVMLMLLRVDNSRPNFEVHLGDDMAYSPAYQSFEANRNFTNGRTLQPPVAGTIARGTQPFHFASTPQDAVRAGEQLTCPWEINTESGNAAVKRGQVVYRTYCAACHGGDGAGNGPVAKKGFPPPPSLLTGKSLQMKDGQLFHILTLGQNSMPDFAAQLPPLRRWEVIAHIRSLQQKATSATAPAVEASSEPEDLVDSGRKGDEP